MRLIDDDVLVAEITRDAVDHFRRSQGYFKYPSCVALAIGGIVRSTIHRPAEEVDSQEARNKISAQVRLMVESLPKGEAI